MTCRAWRGWAAGSNTATKTSLVVASHGEHMATFYEEGGGAGVSTSSISGCYHRYDVRLLAQTLNSVIMCG